MGIANFPIQYFTSSFISSVPGIYGDCTFNNGVVFLPEFTNLVEPESSWPAADIAIISQEWSTVHGYNRGIYAKSNSDSNFTVTADSPDYLGNWTCTEDKSVTFSADTSIDTINSTLTQNQFLYANSRGVWHTIPGLPDTQDGLLMWSSSDPTESGRKWDVKASIAPSHDVGQPIVMSNFDCTMTGPQIEWILPLIPSVDTLDDWGSRTYGYLVQGSDYSNPGDDSTFGFGLEVMLNAMTMVAGTLNTATRSANGAYNSPSTYRCKLERTIICKEVFAMLGFLLLHLFCFVLLSIKYWFQIHTSDRARRKAIKEVPSSASSWQVAVLRDHFPDQASYITAKDISQYRYGWDANGSNVLRFTRKGAEGVCCVCISPLCAHEANVYIRNMWKRFRMFPRWIPTCRIRMFQTCQFSMAQPRQFSMFPWRQLSMESMDTKRCRIM